MGEIKHIVGVFMPPLETWFNIRAADERGFIPLSVRCQDPIQPATVEDIKEEQSDRFSIPVLLSV